MTNRSKQRNLTDDDIVDMLINYIDENLYNYAVMIDGEWGGVVKLILLLIFIKNW